MFANSDEPEILAKGVIAKNIPESVAMITIHVVCVRKSVVGRNEAAYCAKADTKNAVPSKKKREAKCY